MPKKLHTNPNTTFRSMKALQEAQSKVKAEYEQLEDNMFSSIFDPQALGLGLVSRVLNPSEGGLFSLNSIMNLFKGKKKPKEKVEKAAATNAAALKAVTEPKKKKNTFVKKVAVSFLKWQAFNLACWGLGKAYDAYKEQRKKKKSG